MIDVALVWCWDVEPGLHPAGCRVEVWLPVLELGTRAGDLLLGASHA